MTRDASFYFANLGADVSRCVRALESGDEARYQDSLARAQKTCAALRGAKRPEAYEESLLLLRGLELARRSPSSLTAFNHALTSLITPFSSRLIA